MFRPNQIIIAVQYCCEGQLHRAILIHIVLITLIIVSTIVNFMSSDFTNCIGGNAYIVTLVLFM